MGRDHVADGGRGGAGGQERVGPVQAALCRRPTPAGTVAAAHVIPPSVLMAMAPCP